MSAPDALHPLVYRMLRPVAGLGVFSAVLIAVSTALGVALAWSTWNTYFVVERFLADDPAVGVLEVYAADDAAAVVTWSYLAALVVSGVVFVTWLYRTRLNAEVLCQATHRRSRGWVVGSWICPIVNLWFPFQVVSDIWKASRPDSGLRVRSLELVSGSPRLALWWGCWVTSFVIDRIAAKVIYDAKKIDLEMVRSMAIAESLSAVLTAVAAVLMIMTMRQISRWQTGPGE